MSDLLDLAENPRTLKRKPPRQAEVPRRLTREDDFLRIVGEVVAEHIATPEHVAEWEAAGYRRRGIGKTAKDIFAARWELKNLQLQGEHQGVTAETFKHMVNAAIAGMKKTLDNQQGNGEWVISKTEFDIRRRKNGDDVVLLVCVWTDARGERDIRYYNGVPVADPELHAPELVDALKANVEKDGGDPELKTMMKQLVALMLMREAGGLTPDVRTSLGLDTPAPAPTPEPTRTAPKQDVLKHFQFIGKDAQTASAEDVPQQEEPEPPASDLPAAERVIEEQPSEPLPHPGGRRRSRPLAE